jgi:hypothetical protein
VARRAVRVVLNCVQSGRSSSPPSAAARSKVSDTLERHESASSVTALTRMRRGACLPSDPHPANGPRLVSVGRRCRSGPGEAPRACGIRRHRMCQSHVSASRWRFLRLHGSATRSAVMCPGAPWQRNGATASRRRLRVRARDGDARRHARLCRPHGRITRRRAALMAGISAGAIERGASQRFTSATKPAEWSGPG